MKILHVSTSDFGGGAARAATRVHRALLGYGINSQMRVIYKGTNDENVIAGIPRRTIVRRLAEKFRLRWRLHTQRGWYTDNPIMHTFGYDGVGLVDELNSSNADIINLHWISGMLSVKDIGRLKKPIVWRLADMWAFCGGEHYEPDIPSARFRNGYLAHNRPGGERGPDLNRQTWEAKRHAWARQPFNIVCTTRWMATCARESVLFRAYPICIIPNALDTKNLWRPVSKDVARIALGLPKDKKLVLMGADRATTDHRKGGDLLHDAIAQVVAHHKKDIELMIYGQNEHDDLGAWPCPVHWLGRVNDDRLLLLMYSAADVMVVPSRQEAFGQTASEAQACGIPVAAFNIGGLPDIVTHRETGWLATPFETGDLARGIIWILADEDRHVELSAAARRQAVERFSEPVIAKAYTELYAQVLSRSV